MCCWNFLCNLVNMSLWSLLCNCINIFPALQSNKKQGMLSNLAAWRQADAKDRDTIPPSPPRSNTHGPCSAPARWHSEVYHQPGSFEPFTCITILYSAQFQLRKSVAILTFYQFVALFFSYSGDLIRIINRMTWLPVNWLFKMWESVEVFDWLYFSGTEYWWAAFAIWYSTVTVGWTSWQLLPRDMLILWQRVCTNQSQVCPVISPSYIDSKRRIKATTEHSGQAYSFTLFLHFPWFSRNVHVRYMLLYSVLTCQGDYSWFCNWMGAGIFEILR
jgi:hypothetical protein